MPEKMDDDSTLWHGIIYDITERKLSEEKLRKSEELYRTILKTAVDGFWIINLQGNLLSVNDSYCSMSGYSENELLSMKITDLDCAEKTDETVAHMQKVITHGEDRFETKHRRKDGSVFYVEISVKYESKDSEYLVAFMHDITERKRAEDELKTRVDELQRFQRLTVGREHTMIDLKKEVNELLRKNGHEEKYTIVD
jgi:PAS domain S-box-containing protein